MHGRVKVKDSERMLLLVAVSSKQQEGNVDAESPLADIYRAGYGRRINTHITII